MGERSLRFQLSISRKVERGQKNMGRERERGKEETFPSLPSSFSLILLFCSRPNFLDDLTGKRLLRKLGCM